jgi:hypothetical protein
MQYLTMVSGVLTACITSPIHLAVKRPTRALARRRQTPGHKNGKATQPSDEGDLDSPHCHGRAFALTFFGRNLVCGVWKADLPPTNAKFASSH